MSDYCFDAAHGDVVEPKSVCPWCLRERIAELEDRIAFKDRFIKELEATAKLADAALTAIGALINESHGVAWLHLNGDIAPWGELLAGGRYEGWLIPLSDYWEARQEQEK